MLKHYKRIACYGIRDIKLFQKSVELIAKSHFNTALVEKLKQGFNISQADFDKLNVIKKKSNKNKFTTQFDIIWKDINEILRVNPYGTGLTEVKLKCPNIFANKFYIIKDLAHGFRNNEKVWKFPKFKKIDLNSPLIKKHKLNLKMAKIYNKQLATKYKSNEERAMKCKISTYIYSIPGKGKSSYINTLNQIAKKQSEDFNINEFTDDGWCESFALGRTFAHSILIGDEHALKNHKLLTPSNLEKITGNERLPLQNRYSKCVNKTNYELVFFHLNVPRKQVYGLKHDKYKKRIITIKIPDDYHLFDFINAVRDVNNFARIDFSSAINKRDEISDYEEDDTIDIE